MRTKAAIGTLAALIACDRGAGRVVDEGAPPPPLPGELFACGKYVGVPNALGYCIASHGERLRSLEEVEAICPRAGDWEGECRRAWVSGQLNPNSRYSTEQLVAACGPNTDCAFEILDFRPAATVDAQIDRCTAHAGEYRNDCVVHAMERWWRAHPAPEEVARVAALRSQYPNQIGYYVAAAVACQGVGSCEGDPEVRTACERGVGQFQQDPGTCPSPELRPMRK